MLGLAPEVVEELVWLRQTWQAAYQTPAASPALAGDWHDRYRPGVVRRIKTTAGTCCLEQHQHQPQNGQPPPGSAPGLPAADELAQIATWWGEHRDQPAPEPAAVPSAL